MSRKFKFYWNVTGISGTLHEEQYTLLIISFSVLLRMKNMPDESCSEQQNTFYIQQLFFLKNVPFMRLCGKIL